MTNEYEYKSTEQRVFVFFLTLLALLGAGTWLGWDIWTIISVIVGVIISLLGLAS